MTSVTVVTHEEAIEWRRAENRCGRAFEFTVARNTTRDTAPPETAQTTTDTEPRIDAHIVINWPASGDVWAPILPESPAQSYILRYKLDADHTSDPWSWKLGFTNIVNGRFEFIDGSENEYSIDCERLGDHYVRFNSAKPAIKQILFIRQA